MKSTRRSGQAAGGGRAPDKSDGARAPKPRRTRRTPEAARENILEAARTLIAEVGPDAVAIKDVARLAGVSRTLVLHYFGGYEPLVQEVLRTGVQRFRALMLAEVRSEGPVEPAAWIALVFDELRNSTTGRLVLWALLSRRLEGPDAFFHREQGLKLLCDAMQERLVAVYGDQAPERAALESTVVLGIAAAWGYVLGGAALWGALGKAPDEARDREARDRLGRMLLQSVLGSRPAPGRR